MICLTLLGSTLIYLHKTKSITRYKDHDIFQLTNLVLVHVVTRLCFNHNNNADTAIVSVFRLLDGIIFQKEVSSQIIKQPRQWTAPPLTRSKHKAIVLS